MVSLITALTGISLVSILFWYCWRKRSIQRIAPAKRDFKISNPRISEMPKTMPVPRTNLVVLESGEPRLSTKPPVPARQTSQIAEISTEGPYVNESCEIYEEIMDTVKQQQNITGSPSDAYLNFSATRNSPVNFSSTRNNTPTKGLSPCFAKIVTLAVQAEIEHSFESETSSFPPPPPPLPSPITK